MTGRRYRPAGGKSSLPHPGSRTSVVEHRYASRRVVPPHLTVGSGRSCTFGEERGSRCTVVSGVRGKSAGDSGHRGTTEGFWGVDAGHPRVFEWPVFTLYAPWFWMLAFRVRFAWR